MQICENNQIRKCVTSTFVPIYKLFSEPGTFLTKAKPKECTLAEEVLITRMLNVKVTYKRTAGLLEVICFVIYNLLLLRIKEMNSTVEMRGDHFLSRNGSKFDSIFYLRFSVVLHES